MKISCLEGHEYYNDLWFYYDVLLDGEPCSNCVVADEELGEVVCYGEGDRSGLFFDYNDYLFKVVKHGKVELIFNDKVYKNANS